MAHLARSARQRHPSLMLLALATAALGLACGEQAGQQAGPDAGTADGASEGALSGSPGAPETPAGRDAGTRRMVARLDSVAEMADLGLTLYHSDHRVEALRARPPGPDLRSRLTYGLALSDELLHAGRFTEAVATYDSVRSLVDMRRDSVPADFAGEVLERLAAAHLHRSFQRRCVDAHTVAPCLLSPEPSAPDPTDEDARAAIRIYRDILRDRSDDLRSRWLMNLAYMRVGEYPDSVPAGFLVPPDALRSEDDVGFFRDVAPELGVDVLGRAGGAILDDFDRDGYLDVLVSSWGVRDPMAYFRNDGDGTFTDRTAEAGLAGITGGLQTVQADYDNDGFLDVLVLRGAWFQIGYPNSLLHNRGDGTFEDMTEAAGLLEAHPTQTAVWGDFDNDGLVDLFVGNESTEGTNTDPAQLFRNGGDGTFTDVAETAGVAVVGFIKGVTAGDYDDDGLLDLYVSRLGEPNLLFHNGGPGEDGIPRFTDVAGTAGVAEPVNSFPTWFFDYDDDGRLDLFVSGYWANPDEVAREYLGLTLRSGTPRLYRNAGDGTFDDVTRSAGLEHVLQTMGSNFGDLDNDGYPDLYLGTGDPDVRSVMPSRMFRNDGGRTFREVTTSGGFGILAKGHGVSFGDADNDGDQDIYVTLGGAYRGDRFRNVLLANPGHGHAWITLRLEGVRSNRAGIGARIRVGVDTPTGPRDVHATVGSGGSFGASSLQQEMGLGEATAIREIEVWWPADGRRDVYRDVRPNRIYLLREGAAAPEPLAPGSFDLAGAAGAGPR